MLRERDSDHLAGERQAATMMVAEALRSTAIFYKIFSFRALFAFLVLLNFHCGTLAMILVHSNGGMEKK